jgi:hypothetical protein
MILKSNKAYSHAECPPLPVLTQTTINGKRHYVTPDGAFISITSLLSSQVPDSIISWRESIGNDVADYVMRTAGRRGTRVHKLVELALSNKPLGDITDYGVLPVALFDMMQPALDKIDQIMALEQPLYSAELGIAGTADTVCSYDGVPSVVDYKTSSKIREDVERHMIQGAFYASAWTWQTKMPIDQVVIIMAAEDGRMQVFKDKPSAHLNKLRELAGQHSLAT